MPDGDLRRTLIGWWKQQDGGNAADFGPGGYTQSYLVFKTNGLLGVIRFYGPERELQHRLDLEVGYTVQLDGTIVLGEHRDHRPAPNPKDLEVRVGSKGDKVTITRPALSFPTGPLPYSTNGDDLRIGTKTYTRSPAPPR